METAYRRNIALIYSPPIGDWITLPYQEAVRIGCQDADLRMTFHAERLETEGYRIIQKIFGAESFPCGLLVAVKK